jgi:hypothetical protein
MKILIGNAVSAGKTTGKIVLPEYTIYFQRKHFSLHRDTSKDVFKQPLLPT